MEQNKQVNKKDNSKPIMLGIIVVLLGVIGYLLFNNTEKTEVIQVQAQKISTDSVTIYNKVSELEELQLAYHRIKMDRESMGLRNDSLNQQITQLNEYIAKVKRDKNANVGKLNSMIAKLKADLDAKDAELVALRAQNDTLKTNVAYLSKEKADLTDTIVNLTTKKTELEEKVAIASVLRAENVFASVINKKGKELTKEEYKAKLIDKLKVTFVLGENRVARKDKKNLMIKLVQPDGSTLFDLATGGGFFVIDGKEVPYTAKKEIEFDNSKQQITFVYVKGSPFKAGKYNIEIFGDGHKIGETTLAVK